MTSPNGITLPAAAGVPAVAPSTPNSRRRRPPGRYLPALLAALAGCTDNAFYVRSGDSAGIPIDTLGLDAAALDRQTLDVAVTFKSDGVVQPYSSDTLFRSVQAGLKSGGFERLHRWGGRQTDVSREIAAMTPADPGAVEMCAIPRLLVLVENHPDLRDGTEAKYFVSGMTFGAWSLSKPTDRYDITLAYRDAHGRTRVYRGHQDLIFSTGSTVFGRDEEAVAGLRRYDDPLAAFGAVMNNSIRGGPGVVQVGRPEFEAQAANAAGAGR